MCRILLRDLTDEISRRDIVGLQVLTAVITKSPIFWFVTPCSWKGPDVSEEQAASIFWPEEYKSRKERKQ
jgi:hypothetical protein